MKYIPVKILHYTELKRGDLFHPVDNLELAKGNWCGGFKFISYDVEKDVLNVKLVKNSKYNTFNENDTKFFISLHNHVVLVRIDGDGTGATRPLKEDEPNQSESKQLKTQTI